MSTSSTGALFTGSSQFAGGLQASLNQAIAIASQPLEQTQSDLATVQSQQTELNTLSSDFTAVQSAVQNIASAAGTNSFTATLSNSAVASIALGSTAELGNYTLEVDSPGAYASSSSSDGLTTVSDPTTDNISDATGYTLTVGTATYTITPGSDTLSALATAINQNGNAQATIVNIGSSAAPDYRLFLEGQQLGDNAIQLTANDGSNPGQTLLTAQVMGAPATYRVNGQPAAAPISTDTPTVTIAPGMTATIQAVGVTTIAVTGSTTNLTNALTSLVNAYNGAMTELNNNRGTGTGALNGDSIVNELQQSLESLVGFTSLGSNTASLTDLGFSFDDNGVLSFDPSTIQSASNSQLQGIMSFLGSATGGGFLANATNITTSISDPTTGLLPAAVTADTNEVTSLNQTISDQQASVNDLQVTLTTQMNAADAAIAALEQQQLYLQSLFTQEQVDIQANSL